MDKATILIVDDDTGLRKTLADIFRLKGYETLTAGSGAEGVAFLESSAVNVALIDLGLPDMSGIDLLYKVKMTSPAIEAIILTGNATLDSAIEATNRGAFSYLLKPYDIDKLLLHIQRALEKQRAGEQFARHSAELERNNLELKALYEVSLASSRTTVLNELLSGVLHALARTEIFPFAMKGAIFLVEGAGMRLASSATLAAEFLPPRKNGCTDQYLCGLAMTSEEIVLLRGSSEERRYTSCNPALPPHGHIIVPLRAEGKTVGLLCLYTPPDCTLSEALLGLLGAIGEQIGVGISNARLYEETKSSSLHDPLTGLANRRFMEIQLEKIFEITKRYDKNLTVIMMDIDHFKNYNDSFGHQEGDRLLAKVAAILTRETRHADYLFRYGGEEFLAILPDANLKMAVRTAERLRSSVEAEAGVTISLGVAVYGEGLHERETLLCKADEALYQAKQNGRNRVETAST